jgi:hypothetical protein
MKNHRQQELPPPPRNIMKRSYHGIYAVPAEADFEAQMEP